MAITLAELASGLESAFPSRWAEPWDSVGLTVGRREASLSRVLIGLDVTEDAVDRALAEGCELLLTHHPFPWHESRRFDLAKPETALLARVMSGGLNLFAVHTNLDAAPSGHATQLAQSLGISESEPLKPTASCLAKVVVFAPAPDAPRVREAMTAAGAGEIGDYRGCSFSLVGTGRYIPGPAAQPRLGVIGEENLVREERIEVVCPEAISPRVLAAARSVHPYEEMAYDVWPLSTPEPGVGMGRLGRVVPTTAGSMATRLKQVIGAVTIQVVGPTDAAVDRVAVCPGSAGDLIEPAIAAGAQLLIGGEFSHHNALRAASHGLILLDGGHFATEIQAVGLLRQCCLEIIGDRQIGVLVAANQRSPFVPY